MRIFPHRVWWIALWCRIRRRHNLVKRPDSQPMRAIGDTKWYVFESALCENCQTGVCKANQVNP